MTDSTNDQSLWNFIATLEDVMNIHNFDILHGQRVADLAIEIAKRMDEGTRFTEPRLLMLKYGAVIHDLGRAGIDDQLLVKPTKLTKAQRAAMEEHSQIGYDLLKRSNLPYEITSCVLYHHEHWDGSGYPNKLVGLEIPLNPRIVCIADVWDALISKRPYHPARSIPDGLAEMNKCIEWFDPKLYAIFLSIIHEYVNIKERTNGK